MSYIGKNIKKIRTVKRLSQQSFAELFNITRASVGSYEELRAEPKIETIINISRHFKITIDALLTKELTVNELLNFDLFREDFENSTKTISSPKLSLQDRLDLLEERIKKIEQNE